MNPRHTSLYEMELALANIRESPRDSGILELIVRRPQTNEREVLEEAALDVQQGLVGDKWREKPNRDCQITVMNSRAAAAVAGDKEAWPLAGDQLYIDLDLSAENFPAGTHFALGGAVLEVSAYPHAGCKKFAARYGPDAVTFVNSPIGTQLRLRGINARVIQSGVVRIGDRAEKIGAAEAASVACAS